MNPLPPLSWLRSHHEAIVDELVTLVEHESPSREKASLDALAGILAGRFQGLGAAVEVVANRDGGDHVLARLPGPATMAPALILGHFDTVWPLGTLEHMPVRRDGGTMAGPGVFDMKASLAMTFAVLDAMRASALPLPRPLTVLFTSDEEIGSPSSRRLIEDLARSSAHVLVLEPPLADGSLKTARKGIGRFGVTVEGRAAHAGVAPEEGASAILELAHQVVKIHELNDPEAGTSLNVGLIQGGTTPNVVPASAVAQVDVRVTSMDAARAVERAIHALAPVDPRTRIHVEGSFNRPPMERTPAVAALFQRAREIGRGLGLELTEGSTGGGSDGNFTAALGIPTLDGLGVRGGGAHARDEHIRLDSLLERASLLAALLLHL